MAESSSTPTAATPSSRLLFFGWLICAFCSKLLGDMGAEVIKIETPDGDPVRRQGAMVDGFSWYFAEFNRNKRSVVLDLYSDAGKDVLAKLIETADVLIENYRPGVLRVRSVMRTVADPKSSSGRVEAIGADDTLESALAKAKGDTSVCFKVERGGKVVGQLDMTDLVRAQVPSAPPEDGNTARKVA